MTHIIEVDFVGFVFVDGEPVGTHLTQKEHQLLRAVMAHSHVASKEFILSALYGGMDEPELKIIDVFATKVRAKLGVHRDAIQTAWGRGYYRNRDYQIVPPTPTSVAVNVDAASLENLMIATGEVPDEILSRLVKAETKRLYAQAA